MPQAGIGHDAVVDGPSVVAREALNRRVEKNVLLAGQLGMKPCTELDHAADSGSTSDEQVAARRLMDPGDDFEERALARAVPADEAERLAVVDLERH